MTIINNYYTYHQIGDYYEKNICRFFSADLPVIYISGDSTVHNKGDILGWGDVIGKYFNVDDELYSVFCHSNNVYMAGYYNPGTQTACWWKNFVCYPLDVSDSTATSIFVRERKK